MTFMPSNNVGPCWSNYLVLIAGQFVGSFLTRTSVDRSFRQAQLMQEWLLWAGAGGQFLEKSATKESIEFIRDCYPSDSSANVYGYEYTSGYNSLDNHDYDSTPEWVERTEMKKFFMIGDFAASDDWLALFARCCCPGTPHYFTSMHVPRLGSCLVFPSVFYNRLGLSAAINLFVSGYWNFLIPL